MTFTELWGEQVNPQPVGQIDVRGDHHVQRRPAWLILVRALAVIGMFAIGYALVLPSLPLPIWKSVIVATGLLLLYVGVAFFVRPECNTDNMGWMGGLIDNPWNYSDDMNRHIFALYKFLGPGRFVAATFLEVCTLFGVDFDDRANGATTQTPTEHPDDRFAAELQASQQGPGQDLASMRFFEQVEASQQQDEQSVSAG